MAVGLVALVVALDQGSKWWVIQTILPYESRPLTSWFSLSHSHNSGAVLGLFSTAPPWVMLILTLGAGGLMLLWFWRARNQFERWPLALILGGAIGNVLDRMRYGYVEDFLDFHLPHGAAWPTFNLADSAITTGAVLLLISGIFFARREDASDTLSHR